MGKSTIAILFTALLATAASWTAAADAPSLAKFVPEDVTYYEGLRRTPASNQVLEPYREAVRELIRSGIAKDLFDLVTSDLSPQQRDEIRSTAHKAIEILRTPSWKDLLREQCSFSFRLAGPIPEVLVLFAVPPESGPARLAEFRKAFAASAELAPEILQTGGGQVEGAETARLGVKGTPFALSAAASKGLVALSTSEVLLQASLALAGSGDGKGSLAASPRFASAFDGLAPGEEVRMFFDLPGYFGLIRSYLGMARAGAGNDPEASGWISVADTVLDELGRLGPASAAGRVRDQTISLDGKLAFVQKDGPGFIEKLLRDQKPIDYSRIVPRDARGFYITSGVNPARIYDAVLDLIRGKVPSGPRVLERWEKIQSRIGFHLREDLLSWLDGGWGWIRVPKGTVVGFRVSDTARAREKVKEALGLLRSFLEGRGQGLEFAEVPGLGEEFREVRIAAFPRFRPVIGLPEGGLFLASSAESVGKILSTFRGETPGFSENPAFAALGFPAGPVQEVFYHDVQNTLEGLADLLAAGGMAASLVPVEGKEAQHVRRLGSILTNLAVFLRRIDIGLDQGGWARYDPEAHALFSGQATRLLGKRQEF